MTPEMRTKELFKSNEIRSNRILEIILYFVGAMQFGFLILHYFNEKFYLGETMPFILLAIGCLNFVFATLSRCMHWNEVVKKYFLFLFLCFSVSVICFVYTWYALLFLPLPILLSARYYDKNFTILISVIMWGLDLTGIFLNMYLEQSNDAVFRHHKFLGLMSWPNLNYAFLGEILPKSLLLFLLVFVAVRLSQNGRKLIYKQSEITAKEVEMETELATAADIQRGVLPVDFDLVPGREIELYAIMVTAKEVGGDFYDFMMKDENTLCVLIADVSDKGLPAAMFMMAAKNSFRMAVNLGKGLSEAVSAVNTTLAEDNNSCSFVTLWAAYIDIHTGKGQYVNAGHMPPLLIGKDGNVRFLENKPQKLVGAFEDAEYTELALAIEKGETLLLYTDGCTDAENAADEMIGLEGLKKIAAKAGSNEPEEICECIYDGISEHAKHCEQFDDITMLAVKNR